MYLIYVFNIQYIYIYVYIPGTSWNPNDPVLIGKGQILEGWSPKIEDKQVPGIYIYDLYIYIYTYTHTSIYIYVINSSGYLSLRQNSKTPTFGTNTKSTTSYPPVLISAKLAFFLQTYRNPLGENFANPSKSPNGSKKFTISSWWKDNRWTHMAIETSPIWRGDTSSNAAKFAIYQSTKSTRPYLRERLRSDAHKMRRKSNCALQNTCKMKSLHHFSYLIWHNYTKHN